MNPTSHSTLLWSAAPGSLRFKTGVLRNLYYKHSTRVLRPGLGSFVDINIFFMKYFWFSFFILSIFSNLLNQNLQNVKTPKKGNSRVSFNDILLNFGLWAHRKPNLWLWMEKSTGNPSLSTQETQPVTLNGEEYRKPINGHTGNPTCDSEWRRVQETHHWAHRKPNLWL